MRYRFDRRIWKRFTRLARFHTASVVFCRSRTRPIGQYQTLRNLYFETGGYLSTVIDLPEFDTGQYESHEFHMVDGNAKLLLKITGLPDFKIHFRRVLWHQFTQLYCCDPAWIKDAYFRVVKVPRSESLRTFLSRDRATLKAYGELFHYRIFLDESGCHEVFAEDVSVSESS